MLNIVFTGPDTNFFGSAFFNFSSFPFFTVFVTSDSSSQIVMLQAANGATTTFTGSGFVLDGSDQIVAGTITGIEFAQGGSVIGTYDDMIWDGATFYDGLVEIGTSGDTSTYHSLINQQDIYFDARDAVVAPDKGGAIKGFSHKFVFDGSDFRDIVAGGAGRDTLKGFNGNDKLTGKAGNDKLIGGSGKDQLSGGKGKDKIDGGKDNDTLSGGRGADVFLFKGDKDEGRDRITDFKDGVDLIRIKGLDFDDLTIRKAGGGADTKIILDSGTEIILEGVQKSLIDAGDFIFV